MWYTGRLCVARTDRVVVPLDTRVTRPPASGSHAEAADRAEHTTPAASIETRKTPSIG